jgi:hypothetical protein
VAETLCPTLPGTKLIDFSKPCPDEQDETVRPMQPGEKVRSYSRPDVRDEGNAVRPTDSLAAVNLSVADCEAQIVANKDFQILKGKINLLITSNQPIEILANRKVPSNKDKVAIALWVEEQKRCSAPMIEYHNSQSPEVGAILDQAYAELFISAADLYQKKITYGDFARATVRLDQEVRERIAAVIARFREQQAEKMRQDAIAKQQELEQQNYRHQQMCESLRQQILIAANSGQTPYQAQQQRRAEQEQYAIRHCASQPEMYRESCYSFSMAGASLATLIAPAMGGVDPLMAEAQQRQALLSQNVDYYKRECQ